MRFVCLAVVALLLAPVAHAAPLWTEGPHGKEVERASLPSFVALAKKLGPAVVNVISIPRSEDSGGGHHGRGQGTGFIINKRGYVLTNDHVVEDAGDIRVRLADERELSARLVGRDEHTDMALLQIDAGADLPVAPLGDSEALNIGEWVMAIGNPFGLDHTVTVGIVSAKGRRDIRPGGPNGAANGLYDFIQTDASINPGNSGGPLINTRGEIVGINTAINAQAQGIGFAIPINIAKVIVPQLLAHGRATRSWLGVYPQPVTTNLAKAFGLGGAEGALIAEVVARSPATEAGLKPGDVIVALDGKKIVRADDLTWRLTLLPPASRVALAVVRDGKPMKFEVLLEAAPDEGPPPTPQPRPEGTPTALGMTVSEISPTLAREMGNPGLRGVVVMVVEPASPAVEAGIERGDLVLRVDNVFVRTLDDYARGVRAVPHGQVMKLLLRRDDKNFWVAFNKR